MSITEEINLIKEQFEQVKAAIDSRQRLKACYDLIVSLERQVEIYKANTGFDAIPTETKQALNRIYQMFLTLKTAVENDPAFEEIINY